MTAKDFAYTATFRVMAGLRQELKLEPGYSYRPDGYNSARVVTLRLTNINPHYLSSVQGLQRQLTMWAGLDDKHQVRIGHGGSNILIEIPKPPTYWKQVTIEGLEARRFIRRGLVATLGLGLQDDPKRINFKEAAMAHVFITGQTRSGKTNTQRLIGWNICRNTTPAEAKLLVFDVAKRGYKWRDFGGSAHLAHPVITEIKEADQVLAWLVAEIERRAQAGYIQPRLFILVDELKSLTDDSKVAAAYLSRIASVGGEFGLHLILATQYPQVKMLGSAELKRNVTTRLCGKVDDASAASNALGLPGTGAETLQGYGDFLLKDFNGVSRMTVAKIEPAHINQIERGETQRLDLPEDDEVGRGTDHLPDQFFKDHAQQLAVAIFDPAVSSINSLQKQTKALGFGVGGEKATRLYNVGLMIQEAARQLGYNCLPSHSEPVSE